MIKNLFDNDDARPADAAGVSASGVSRSLKIRDGSPVEKEKFVLSEAAPESMAQTVRRSGLAWSAGIVLFSSVGFLLILGWLLDLLLGSAPWGVVGGIIIGSLIGFVQFFRITSQIFKQ